MIEGAMGEVAITEGAWLLDVGDTLIYFSSHSAPSGIQRVVLELQHVLRNRIGTQLQLVAAHPRGRGLFRVDEDAWKHLQAAVESGSADVSRHARELLKKSFRSKALARSSGSGLLVLGSAWATPRYLDSLLTSWNGKGSFVPLVYDLTPVFNAQHHDESLAYRFRRTLTAFSFAAAILVISDHTGRDLTSWLTNEELPLPPIKTIRLASSLDQSSKNVFGARLKLEQPFVAIVSTIEGRKGHLTALKAWEKLLEEVSPAQVPDLVFVGRSGWNNTAVLRFLDERKYLNGKVILTGAVSDTELAWVYRNALFTIYPSEYEGWGLPVSESLSFGTPVLASDATSIPEAGGESARYFACGDVNDLYTSLRDWVLSPESLDAWRDRAAEFRADTWSDVAGRIESALADAEQRIRVSQPPRLEELYTRLPPIQEGGALGRAAQALAFSPLVSVLLPVGTRRRRMFSTLLQGLARISRPIRGVPAADS